MPICCKLRRQEHTYRYTTGRHICLSLHALAQFHTNIQKHTRHKHTFLASTICFNGWFNSKNTIWQKIHLVIFIIKIVSLSRYSDKSPCLQYTIMGAWHIKQADLPCRTARHMQGKTGQQIWGFDYTWDIFLNSKSNVMGLASSDVILRNCKKSRHSMLAHLSRVTGLHRYPCQECMLNSFETY